MCILFVVGDGVGESETKRMVTVSLKTCPILQVRQNIQFNPLSEQTHSIHCTYENSSTIPVYEVKVIAHYCLTVLIISFCVFALLSN